jgi:hypothetical protein
MAVMIGGRVEEEGDRTCVMRTRVWSWCTREEAEEAEDVWRVAVMLIALRTGCLWVVREEGWLGLTACQASMKRGARAVRRRVQAWVVLVWTHTQAGQVLGTREGMGTPLALEAGRAGAGTEALEVRMRMAT